jgi:hypothetical protein
MKNVNVDPKKFARKASKNSKFNDITIINNGNSQQTKWTVRNIQENISAMLSEGITKQSIYFGFANNGIVPDDYSVNGYEKKIIEESQIIGDIAIEKFNKAYDGTGLSFSATGKCQRVDQAGTGQKLFGGYVEIEILIDEELINSKTAKTVKKIEDEDEDEE